MNIDVKIEVYLVGELCEYIEDFDVILVGF